MVRLISYNIEYCEGIKGRWYEYLEFWKALSAGANLDKKIMKKLKRLKPDILALIEVDTGSLRGNEKDEVVFAAQKLGLKNFVEKVKYPSKGFLKIFHLIPVLDMQANAIVSKYKFIDVNYPIFHEGTKSIVIEASVNLNEKGKVGSKSKKITLFVVHLALGAVTRAKQIKELVKIINKIKNPVILMGDFNTFGGEKEIKNLLDKTQLDDKIALDKKDKHFTQPSYNPSRRLDYILTSSDIKVRKYKILKFPFSDHLPVMVDFEVKK